MNGRRPKARTDATNPLLLLADRGKRRLRDFNNNNLILRIMASNLIISRNLKGLAVALGSFAALGTVAALWDNPLFVRMTPVGDFEIALLGMLSVLLGSYVAIRRPFCSTKTVSAGGVLGFIGVACPVCNKILLLLFGGDLLLTYFDPLRVYVAAAGVLLTAWAVAREWALTKRGSAEDTAFRSRERVTGKVPEGCAARPGTIGPRCPATE